MKNLSVFVAAFLLSNTPALAGSEILSAKDAFDVCTRPNMHWVDFCNGFFQAVHDSGAESGIVCTPTGTTRTALVELFVAKAKKDPQFATASAVKVATRLFAATFPCN